MAAFVDYRRRLKYRSRELRNDLTSAERKLWFWFEFLRRLPQKFVRQKPLGPYIADFYCAESLLVIEVDGDSHFSDTAEKKDAARTAFLESMEIRVVRFSNNEVRDQFAEVCERIIEFL